MTADLNHFGSHRSGSRFAMTELEGRLNGEHAAMERQAMLGRLRELEAQLRKTMGAGLSRSQFDSWQLALAAVAAATETLRSLPPASPPSMIDEFFRRT